MWYIQGERFAPPYANIKYKISAKGLSKTDQYKLLDGIIQRQGGIIRTGDVLAEGIGKAVFTRCIKLRGLERIGHGIYIAPDAWQDDMYILQLRFPQAVFSHDSELCLHGMTDRVPLRHSVTLKTGYNPSSLTREGIKAYTVKESLYSLGVTYAATIFGNQVKAYDPERTVCDILRSRRGIEEQVFQDALKMYVRRRDKDIGRLIGYAEKLRVKNIAVHYISLLLS